MSTYLYRLAKWSLSHRRLVLALWLLLAVAMIVLGTMSGGKTNDNFTIPGTESDDVATLLTRQMPAAAGGQTQIVLATHGNAKITDAGNMASIGEMITKLRAIPGVVAVGDPFQTKTISPSGQAAIATVQYSQAPADVPDSTFDAVRSAVEPAQNSGVQVEYSGSAYPGWLISVSEVPEIVGMIIAFVILLVTFGAFVAAGLPILNAIVGIVVTLMGVTALASVVTIASASTTVAIMLGLSCGIDYALFILSRHRNNLMTDMSVEDSVPLAVGTAGSSVVFAGITVIVALCGLAVAGIPFLTVMGLAAAAAVLVALLVSLTLLPALLGFAGWTVAKFLQSPLRPGRPEAIARQAVERPERTAGAVWARFVVRWRIPVLILGIALLALIAAPATQMNLGLPSGSSKPTSDTQRRAYDIVAENFGPGYNGPLLVVVDNVTDPAQVTPIMQALSKLPMSRPSFPQPVTALWTRSRSCRNPARTIRRRPIW
ncbi:MMPL family transporter [Nocardia miyunensis]|uniref:MMPL family transporter n=1 Tax=Nocardia miyunensis TaxID=282684 RepID=UPI000AE5A98A|nr:MMPL family transporter [Nocardia miyunensis]